MLAPRLSVANSRSSSPVPSISLNSPCKGSLFQVASRHTKTIERSGCLAASRFRLATSGTDCQNLRMKRTLRGLGFAMLLATVHFSIASPVVADQSGGQEIYSRFWRYGERITITQCVGLVKFRSWGRTRMSGPPEFQVRVNGEWKTVARSSIVSGTDNCAKPSDFPAGVTVDRIVKVQFSWVVSEVGDGSPDTRYSGCNGSARQLQVRNKYPNSPYPPRPMVVIVCS